jgi:acetylornithine/succinyldiaminopimelate/putrescine aminotransferase
MQRINGPARAAEAGARLMDGLRGLHGVAEVRGLGLLIAAQLDEGIDARQITTECLSAGLVINAVTPTALRLAPPLTVSEGEIDEAVAILGKVLEAAAP